MATSSVTGALFGIPSPDHHTYYDAIIAMPSQAFASIVKELSATGEGTIVVEVRDVEVLFASSDSSASMVLWTADAARKIREAKKVNDAFSAARLQSYRELRGSVMLNAKAHHLKSKEVVESRSLGVFEDVELEDEAESDSEYLSAEDYSCHSEDEDDPSAITMVQAARPICMAFSAASLSASTEGSHLSSYVYLSLDADGLLVSVS